MTFAEMYRAGTNSSLKAGIAASLLLRPARTGLKQACFYQFWERGRGRPPVY